MTLKCPKCKSERIDSKTHAKKTCSTIVGAAAVAAGVMGGAEMGLLPG